MNPSETLSVVIPALNAATTLPQVLTAVLAGSGALVDEVIVVDGGSTDGTPEIAASFGARVLSTPRGRGVQLRAGGGTARSDWLMFLHADTRLEPDWVGEVRGFMGERNNRECAAVFRFRLDQENPAARRVERLVAWRNRRFRLPYGDQALLLHQELYGSVDGFRPMPLFEDVDMVRRLGRHRIRVLEAAAVTSAARYQRDGWWLRPLRNIFCLILYLVGVPPPVIERIYR